MKTYQVNKIVKNSTILVKEVTTLYEAHEVYNSIKGKKEIKNLETGNIIEANY